MKLDSLFARNNGMSENVKSISLDDSLYPSSRGELESVFNRIFRTYKKMKSHDNVSGIIIPHAGYLYSGKIAAAAIAHVDPEKSYERIFIIGTSHQIYIDGASIDIAYDYYDTPFGRVKVDTSLCKKLIYCNSCFTYRPSAHHGEHCIEVQLPILKYYLKDMPPIIPIIVGTDSIHLIMSMADALQPYFGSDNLFVVSSDFSHYPSYEDAVKVDSLTASAIMKCSLDDFVEAVMANSKSRIANLETSACGQSSIAMLLYLMSHYNDIKIEHTGYANSGDSKLGNRNKVVGYHSFVFTRDSFRGVQPSLRFSPQEKRTLLAMARNSIEKRFFLARTVPSQEWKLTENMKRKCGVFVSIIKDGKIRGCIGHFGTDVAVYQNVIEMAKASAFDDPRFISLQPEEVENINIEISVLTPMKRIYDLDDFVIGKHGLYIYKNGRSGTFLPQVASEVNWNKLEYLGHCSRDKAGIGWEGWKDAELYVYEAIVFKEFSTKL